MQLGYEYQSLKDADIRPKTRIFLNRFVPAIQRINSDKNLTVKQLLQRLRKSITPSRTMIWEKSF